MKKRLIGISLMILISISLMGCTDNSKAIANEVVGQINEKMQSSFVFEGKEMSEYDKDLMMFTYAHEESTVQLAINTTKENLSNALIDPIDEVYLETVLELLLRSLEINSVNAQDLKMELIEDMGVFAEDFTFTYSDSRLVVYRND